MKRCSFKRLPLKSETFFQNTPLASLHVTCRSMSKQAWFDHQLIHLIVPFGSVISTGQLLHRGLLHTHTHRRLYIYTKQLLHTEACRFYTGTPLRRAAFTQTDLHKEAFTHDQGPEQPPCDPRRKPKDFQTFPDAFTHRRFYTQTSFHRVALARRSFYTGKPLHTRSFTTGQLLHRSAEAFAQGSFTHRSFYTEQLLHTEDHRSLCTKSMYT